MWAYDGSRRPPFAQTPGSGQESVWDYPRPPRVEADTRLVEVKAGGVTLASTRRALRVLETASPPGFYLPAADVDLAQLQRVAGRSLCEWKGAASYWALAGATAPPIAWTYDDPLPAFAAIRGCFAFYASRVECFVDDERVTPQPGGFYGGWVTQEIVGPMKGEPGTGHW
jgi:uncharacterized protein (DUF427 family)